MILRYRAWDSWRKRMSVVDRIYIDTEGVRLYDDFGEYWRDFRDVKLMQSTGLRDKNDKEIFEGDILKSNKYTTSVFYERGAYCVKFCRTTNTTVTMNVISFIEKYKTKIIGNVYENPELLEDKE